MNARMIAASLLVTAARSAAAQEARPVCTDNSRPCLLRTATLYLDGLTRHDASAIPFTPDVRCTEQGLVPVTDAATFRREINSSTLIKGARNMRLLADPATKPVAAFYMLDVAGSNGEPDYTVRRGQRFKIVGGRVAEVEVYNYVDPQQRGLAPPLWPD